MPLLYISPNCTYGVTLSQISHSYKQYWKSSTITCLFLDYMFSPPHKVIGKSSEVLDDTGTEEKYLIATSEQTLCALHR